MIEQMKLVAIFCGIILVYVKGSPLIDNGVQIKNVNNGNVFDDSFNVEKSLLLNNLKKVKPTSWSDLEIDLAILKSVNSLPGELIDSTLRLSLPAHLTIPSPLNIGIFGNITQLTITSPFIESMNGVRTTKKEAIESTVPKSSADLNGVFYDFGNVSTGVSNGFVDLGFKAQTVEGGPIDVSVGVLYDDNNYLWVGQFKFQ